MKPVLGIDFGTTNTAAAWVDAKGTMQIVPVREDANVLPSVVSFHGSGQPLVGHSARELIVDDPQHTIWGVKRFLGRRFLSDFVGRNRGRFVFKLVEGTDGMTAVEMNGAVVPLEDVAFHILARIVELAHIAAGEQFEECVISVPANYTFRQRQVIRRVAERLLSVKSMINEPTAAALYFAKGAGIEERVLVYDLGGGTFDATLLHLHDGLVEVLGTGGDAFLGGTDFDLRIVEDLLERFQDEQGLDLHADVVVAQRVQFAAERAKIALSTDEQTNLRVPCVAMRDDHFLDLQAVLTRRDLETLCAPLIERTLGICEQIMARAGVRPADLSETVLVGGMTRMPALRTRIAQVFPVNPRRRIDPDIAVAVGAALHGQGAQRLVDVISVPIGVMIPGAPPEEAVRQSMPLPAVRRVKVARPAAGKPLNMIFFEAVDLTSIDRDILGNVQVPADWLANNHGDLALEVRMSASFELSIFIHASEGGRLPLELAEPRSAPKAAPAPQVTTGSVARTDDRVPVQARVMLRVLGQEPFVCEAENLSRTGMLVRTRKPLSNGTRLEVEIDAHGKMVRVAATVVRSVDGETAPLVGETAGMGLRFEPMSPDARDAIERYLTLLPSAAGMQASEVAVEQAKKGTTPTLRDALEPIQRFLAAVAANNLYDALQLQPLASDDEVRAALKRLKDNLDDTMKRSTGPLRARLTTAENVLVRVHALLLDPRRRLDYDFKCGHVNAEERLRVADLNTIGLLREAWHRAQPEQVDKGALHLAHAMRAAKEGRMAEAIRDGETAARLDPFNTSLRQLLAEWRSR
jgi:molecular chaperone DnaK